MRRFLACAALILAVTSVARAQTIPGFSSSKQFTQERLTATHWRLTGTVEMERDGQSFFAEVVDYYTDTGDMEASGNVVYASKEIRIAADRMVFNAKTRLGTFYNASGTLTLGEKVDRSMFGTQEPDAYFYGEQLEKLDEDKYRIRKGGFTTCVQPTPRWEVTASSATITLDKYAILKNALLQVKGVPLFYMPIFYYPVQEDDRATGFLLPQYGSSIIRGQTLSNAFFWAINRSADATLFHDLYSKAGQGFGSEFRYIAAPGSEGNAKAYILKQKDATYSSGTTTTPVAGSTSYEIRASASQRLPAGLRARANVDYFSSIATQQTYYNNLYDASRRQRVYGGNVAGTWGANSVSATYNVSELFYGATDSTVYGSKPRIALNRAARKLFGSPVYFSLASDYYSIARIAKSGTTETDNSLTRVDISPSFRLPWTKWPFLTFNSSVAFRNTWYSESLDLTRRQVEESLFRRYVDMRAEIVGPVFTRIWDTPTNGFAEKFKHVIEPTVGIQRVTDFDSYNQIVKLDSYDYTLGGTTRINYGLTNRFLAKVRESAERSVSREFLNISVAQTYYSDEKASTYDSAYTSSLYNGEAQSKFSPVSLVVRGGPSAQIGATVRIEYDHVVSEISTLSAAGTFAQSGVQVTGALSQRRVTFVSADGSNKYTYMNGSAGYRRPDGRFGGGYTFSYDFFYDRMNQQRFTAFYNAQCCGITVEYQTFNLQGLITNYGIPRDKRFNIGFSLAGIGTFSNFFGALSGTGTTSTR